MKTKSLYQSKKEFYTDPVSGRFNKIRLFTMSVVAIIYFILPWISINNKQSFLFDVIDNRFYFFGMVFFPQDFFIIAFFIIFCIILLFAITLYVGRIWCGFFCPQSIWIKMAAFITRLFEGKRNTRMKFKSQNVNFYKVCILFFKHFFWIVLSFFTGFTFIAYFIPLKWLVSSIVLFDVFYRSFFWVLFFTFITYFNIGWFKEQFCFLVCPYARLQSAMFDQNTLIVSYDKNRGEKRGAINKKFVSEEYGDCIDCMKCVTCCPTGIDIRDGLQMECISCGACVDACNSVMEKIGYKPNLISFKRELSDKNNRSQSKLKLYLYFVVLVVLFCLINYFLITRPLVHFSVTRSQYQLFNITQDNFVENCYFLKLINKNNEDMIYYLDVEPNIFKINGNKEFLLKPGELKVFNVSLIYYETVITKKNNMLDINFNIRDKKSIISSKKSKFLFPLGDF